MRQRGSHAIVFATRPGGTTIDEDEHGGNPFATALVQLASGQPIPFRRFPARLRRLTVEASGGHQTPQWTQWPEHVSWTFQLQPGSRQGDRRALVLVVSDYSNASLATLSGAATDERRIAAMFAANGFTVIQGITPTRVGLLAALSNFVRLSAKHDVGAIYCTGHGMESHGSSYLLPGDFRLEASCSSAHLKTAAISVERIASGCLARSLNLVFFAGCRTLAS